MQDKLIRFFDIFFSSLALIVLSPLLIPVMIILKLTGEGDKINLYTEAISLLDEAANDQNCPPHIQTMIYQMLADIEKEIEKLRKSN